MCVLCCDDQNPELGTLWSLVPLSPMSSAASFSQKGYIEKHVQDHKAAVRPSWAQDSSQWGWEVTATVWVTHPCYLKTMGALAEEQEAWWVQCSEADFRKLGCFGPACSSFGSARAATLATLSYRSPGRSLSGDASLMVLDTLGSRMVAPPPAQRASFPLFCHSPRRWGRVDAFPLRFCS